MGFKITFNYDKFVALFPQFAYLSEVQMQMYFDLATQFHRNDGGGPVVQEVVQTTLLNLVTAHVAFLFAPKEDNQPSSDLVGRITSASQGTVSVSTDNQYPPGSAQWWNQTKWGSAYWEASKVYRTMRYIPSWPPPIVPWPGYGYGSGGWWGP